MRDVDIPNCRPRGETYAYRLEEVQQFLSVLEGTAKVVIALAAFGGFSKAELQGLRWENYRGNEITVTLNVIRGKIGEPKTEKRQSAVHIIALLNKLLGEYRANVGNPQSGFLFLSENQTPLQLDNLLHREILKCNACGRERYHKVHTLKTFRNFHEYKPLPGLPKWHGWHAFRRGLATNLHRLGVADITIQGILRHEDVATTRRHYIKEAPAAGHNGLERLEAEFLLLDDCRRKLQTTTGSKLVN